eukprot:TRINITY_DN15224_c0_g1_i4.p1 TRINITY_DN15224_c0_g1~~TRINITY_DN15224_c0_g1_i4.p1  ORF type:complete len:176 (+),score=49.19 TRINITY_DN15224_c0_g1_i4:247-774(+)
MVKINPLLTKVCNVKDAEEIGVGAGLVLDPVAQQKRWKLEGQNKSNRPHKSRKAKFSNTIVGKHTRPSFESRMKRKAELEDLKAMEKELINDRIETKRKHRADLKEKEARKRENEIKSASFQNISSEKVKKLGKKQLRMIHKVDFDQIKDARIGVGLKTAFGGMKARGSSGKLRK